MSKFSKMSLVGVLSFVMVMGLGLSAYAENSGTGDYLVIAQMGSSGPGGPGKPVGPGGPGGPGKPGQGGGMNQALDMCYGKCVQSLQMCLRPSLSPGYNANAAKGLVNSCTDALKRCMLSCPR